MIPVIVGLFACTAGGLPAAFGVSVADAGTTTGTGVTISGVDALANTVDTYAKGNLGKIVGIGLGLGAVGLTVAGRTGGAALAATGALGGAFVPNMVGTAYDATAAAPLDTMPLVISTATPWWEPALGLLYPVMLGVKWVRDPVFLAALLLAIGLARTITRTSVRMHHA
jgi:hypothetical protein